MLTEELQKKKLAEAEAEGGVCRQEVADRALLSRPGLEGLDLCSTVEMNSLLIQSK